MKFKTYNKTKQNKKKHLMKSFISRAIFYYLKTEKSYLLTENILNSCCAFTSLPLLSSLLLSNLS